MAESATCRSMRASRLRVDARAEDLGAGEILLTSIEREGTMEGYDVISCAVSRP
jgi:imidazole glycerol phosphate synthase subunit HisF